MVANRLSFSWYKVVCLAAAAVLLAGCRASDRRTELPSPQVRTRPAPQATPRPLLPELPNDRALLDRRIVIDPGHGGPDPGAWEFTLSKLPEKTIVLDVARGLEDHLRRMGARVTMTRTEDRYLDRQARADLAKRHRADLFVSIHANSATSPQAVGSDIYICRSALSQSKRAAECMQSALREAGVICRDIRRADFDVLVRHPQPAILVECGFLTNHQEARRLNDPDYRRCLAAILADGIRRYFTDDRDNRLTALPPAAPARSAAVPARPRRPVVP